jgi:tRNA (adenine22-N1)-methyltransferase
MTEPGAGLPDGFDWVIFIYIYNTWKGAHMATLDQRLLTASQMIIPQRPVADIGTDHGHLPCYLIASGLAPRVIATEWGDGPFQQARERIGKSPWSDCIVVRQGNGLEALQKGEVETVVIMGLGGDLIAAMLKRDWALTASFARLVLQPMTRAGVVRRLLAQQGWPLLSEQVARVNGRFFILLSYQPGSQPYELTLLETEVGSQILQGRSNHERQYLIYCWRKFKKLYEGLALSKQADNRHKRHEYGRLCLELEEIIDAKQG